WVQTKLNPAPADPIQARMFGLMPIMFTFMFATFPAGLVIYYTWNNLLGIAQQWYIMSQQGVEVHLFKNLGDTWKRRTGGAKPTAAPGACVTRRSSRPRASFSQARATSSGAPATSTACRRRACRRLPSSGVPTWASRA